MGYTLLVVNGKSEAILAMFAWLTAVVGYS